MNQVENLPRILHPTVENIEVITCILAVITQETPKEEVLQEIALFCLGSQAGAYLAGRTWALEPSLN